MEQEVQKYIGARLRISSCPFSDEDGVVGLTGKVENVLRSKSENTAVYQKETELNEKGGSASAIMSRRRCIDHPQEWKVLYLSIDRSRPVASHNVGNRKCEPNISIFELIRAIRKPRTRCLSVCCPRTLIIPVEKFRITQSWRTRRMRGLIWLRLRKAREC